MTANAGQKYDLRWSGERPRVSVIMIFLNAERFIAEAIESALAQDYGDLELILVDDGSAETCASLARGKVTRNTVPVWRCSRLCSGSRRAD